MKTIILLLIVTIVFTINFSFAQTNTFPSSGNVGIGTTTPQSSLDVNGNIQISNSSIPMGIMTELPGTSNPLIDLSLNFRETNKNTNYVGAAMRIDSRSTLPVFQWLCRPAGSTIENTLMSIMQGGNVGIGTITPDQLLTVNGTIHAKEVLVDLSIFPDYVFKPAYHLPTLTEVKTYIDQNHHLPDMPTEAEVVKNGLKVGETEALLTKKVEELTLYIIAQNKRIEKLENKLNHKK